MGRQPRLVVAGAPHHVYLRANNRRLLFSSVADRMFWLACLRRALDATECQLHQLTLMSNHIHSIITPPDKRALSALIKRTCQRYAQIRNELRRGSGKLFEERFKAKVITDLAHLRATTLYNDANGFRAGIVADPLSHDWSTAPIHAGQAGGDAIRSLVTPSRWYVQLGNTPSERAAAYRREMGAYLQLGDDALVDEEIRRREDKDAEPATRIRRPDGTSARESAVEYVRVVRGEE
ncbi:MAG TPA: transposase [Kofleriaceae bacterium]|nr:transposase [Kofleriaceae bacterium]